MTQRRPLRPGEWADVPFVRRPDPGYPVGAIKPAEPVAPHTPWERSCCNAFCTGPNGCHATVGLVGGVDGKSVWLEPRPSPNGPYVLEMSPHRAPMAVPFDPAMHDGWQRYREHACPLKG